MPKLKTNRGAAKRFRATAGGFKSRRSFRNHILTKKATKRKRQLRGTTQIDGSDFRSVSRMMPYAVSKSTKRRRLYRAKNENAMIQLDIEVVNEG
jgi:large subunit ribosomal protein L35